jgi:hypothetical protein
MSTSCMLHTITKRADQIDESAYWSQQRSPRRYKYQRGLWAAGWRKCVSSSGSLSLSSSVVCRRTWPVSERDESGAREIASGSGLFLLEWLGYRPSSTRPDFDLHFPATATDHKNVSPPLSHPLSNHRAGRTSHHPTPRCAIVSRFDVTHTPARL